jgi:uncharacterized protein
MTQERRRCLDAILRFLSAAMISQSEQLRHFRSNYLNLIILPTEACNFRCTYCYETFENKKMPLPVVNGIKSLIDRRGAELDELEISWFGGEPLLAFDVISEISKHALDAGKTAGFTFRSGMTTNGYFLNQHRLSQCLDHKIDFFQISLDGNPDEHNASRKLASGDGTFDRIWSNLIAMKDTRAEFVVLLRLHYTMENFISVGQFARRIRDEFGDDRRFRYHFHHVARLGGPNDESITIVSEQDQKEIEAHLWDASGLSRLSDQDETYVCYAAKGNSLVIRSTGRLAKCTVALNDTCNDIGWISENGEISVEQRKYQRWIAPLVEADWDNVSCPLPLVVQQAALDGAH